MKSTLRVGLLIPSKRKFKVKLPDGLLDVCGKENIEVVDLNFETDVLQDNGPFDVLIQKINGYFKVLNHTEAISRIQQVKEYCSNSKDMIVIDNIDACEKLTHRIYQTEVIKSCEMRLEGINVFVPNIIELSESSTIEEAKLIISLNEMKYPLLAKPTELSLTDHEHDMALIFSDTNVQDLTFPCLIQEFCNHGGVMYKVFVVGDNFNICQRPSIKDLSGQLKSTLYFDTRKVSKVNSAFLPKLHSSNPTTRTWLTCDDNPNLLNRNVIRELCSMIRKLTKVNLFGFDILVEQDTGDYALVDINHFPGYTGINGKYFSQHLVQLVKKLWDRKQIQRTL